MSLTSDLSGFLPDLCALVNCQLGSIPPAWTPTPVRLGGWLREGSAWAAHYPESPALVKRDLGVSVGGRLLAAGQYAVVDGTCLLCWIAADSGEPGALEALLGGLAEAAREQGCRAIIQSRNELGTGWFGTPLVWDHVVRGMHAAGWQPDDRWVIMTAGTDAAASVPSEPPFRTLRLDRREDAAAGEWSADVHIGDVPAAESDVWAMPGLFRDCPGYETWMTLEFVGVEEPFRRHGLGRWLCAEQMRWLAGRGIRQAILFTEPGNAAARGLFDSLGFVRGPECWCLHRPVDTPAAIS
jgi:GNAT superfamily N-acetyltransferase